MPLQDDFIRTALRVPRTLHEQLHAAATEANRGFNAEIVARLVESFEPNNLEARVTAIERVLKLRK